MVHPASDTEVRSVVTQMWRDIFGRDVGDTANFFDLGGDSLTAVNFVITLQQRWNVRIELETFLADPTIEALVGLIRDSPEDPHVNLMQHRETAP